MKSDDADTFSDLDAELIELERLSNRAVDLIGRGRLDDAEQVCLELRRRYPDMIDWIERTAALHEARGNFGEAVAHYRRCIGYIDEHPEGFDAESKGWYRDAIERLESEAPDG